ncbi:hypothetical protein QUA62_04475 [Microcoleus sp. MON1_C1]
MPLAREAKNWDDLAKGTILALPYLVCQIISFLMSYSIAGWDFKAIALS